MKLLTRLIVAHGNDLESQIADVFLPEGIARMRGNMVATTNVDVQTEDVAANKGDEVTISLPIEFGDADEMGSDTKGTDSDISTRTNKLKLDNYFYKQFTMTEQEKLASRNEFILPSSLEAAIDAVSRSVEKTVLGSYKQVQYFSGNLGSDAYNQKSLIAAKKGLKRNGFVQNDRRILLHDNTDAAILGSYDQQAQSQEMMISGSLGQKSGFATFEAAYAPEHVAGTAAGNAGLTASAVAGESQITVTGLANGETIVDGDLISLANGTSYTASALATGDGSNPVVVAVYQTVADATDVEATVAGDHDVNLALHPSAITVGFRPLASRQSADSIAFTMIDPVSKIPLTIRHWFENGGRAEKWAVECLMGVKYHDLGRALRMGA